MRCSVLLHSWARAAFLQLVPPPPKADKALFKPSWTYEDPDLSTMKRQAKKRKRPQSTDGLTKKQRKMAKKAKKAKKERKQKKLSERKEKKKKEKREKKLSLKKAVRPHESRGKRARTQ